MSDLHPSQAPAAELLRHFATGDVATLVHSVLDTILRVTGLESSYLTFIDWEAGTQEVRYSAGTGELDIHVGMVAPWEDTLCRRALRSGVHATADADATFGADNAGHDLGIVSYISVPVLTQDQGIYGTLCAASTRAREVDEDVMDLLRVFARMLGRQIDSEVAIGRERERAERAEQRTRARMMMLAESEHRVKTPLSVVTGVAATLTRHWDELDDEKRREMIASISRQSADLLDCVQVLLAQAREEMDELAVSPTALYVQPVLEQVAADHGLAASDHTIGLTCDGPVVARADVVSLQQIVGHLLDNAIKYTPSGGHIALAARTEGDRAVITVADDGPGLPDDLDPFAAFTRGAMSAHHVAGTGLGLHIVRNLATRLGGQVSAQNAPTGGAVFVVELPSI